MDWEIRLLPNAVYAYRQAKVTWNLQLAVGNI